MQKRTRIIENMENSRKLILASQSPRRKEILSKCGIPFTVDVACIDETIDESLPLAEAVMDLSWRKARAVLDRHPDGVIIGSDTIVTLKRKIYGKPKDRADAREMLKELSGCTHEVMTGVCVLSKDSCRKEVSVTKVTFTELDDEEIERYLSTDEAYDKAGAYAIQGQAGCWISRMDGDYYSVMGLPLSRIYRILREQGYFLY